MKPIKEDKDQETIEKEARTDSLGPLTSDTTRAYISARFRNDSTFNTQWVVADEEATVANGSQYWVIVFNQIMAPGEISGWVSLYAPSGNGGSIAYSRSDSSAITHKYFIKEGDTVGLWG